MTVIIYKDGVLATDSCSLLEMGGIDLVFGYAKKIQSTPYLAFAMSGVDLTQEEIEATKMILSCCLANFDGYNLKISKKHYRTVMINHNGESRALILVTKKQVWYLHWSRTSELKDTDEDFIIFSNYDPSMPLAFGSANHIATGALHGGATAEEAVNIAKRLSLTCGGETQLFLQKTLKDTPKLKGAKK